MFTQMRQQMQLVFSYDDSITVSNGQQPPVTSAW